MKRFFIITVTALITVPAFAQSAAEKTGVNSLMGNAPKTADFVKEAAMSDMFEIASSKLALQKGNHATKAFAQQMVTDHQKTTSELKGLVTSRKVKATIPDAMSSSQKNMLRTLDGLQGAGFDRRYQLQQEKAHQDAVDLFKRYGQGGNNADLKAWAASTAPALEHHLQMAEDLNK